MTVYVGSDGRVYTPSGVVERLERGEWDTCLHDAGDGRELVATAAGDLVLLVPVDELDRRPPGVDPRSPDGGPEDPRLDGDPSVRDG